MKPLRPLRALLLSRLREFYREPEAIFWVYGFPVLLAVGLGIAFRERPPEEVRVDVRSESAADPRARDLLQSLGSNRQIRAAPCAGEECARRLRLGRTDIVLDPGPQGAPLEYLFDPT